ncbi:MAG: hypothetical protein MI724_20960 [Spirochaetales bacterium]|nr:hypothetical protein [Spirochaetales bacterium]
MHSTAQSPSAQAATIPTPDRTSLDPSRTLILFYSDVCPHCHNQMRWMAEIEDDFPEIEFLRYEVEVTNNHANQAYFSAMMYAYDSNTTGWPRTVIGDRVFIGFADDDGEAVYNDEYQAWIGYRNQLYRALAELYEGIER